MAKPCKPKKPAPLLSRPEAIGLCKRFVKPESYQGARDLMALYKLLKQFPNRDFWLGHELGFQLNAMFWFLGQEGQAHLQSAWNIFHLDTSIQVDQNLSATKQGEDVVIDRRPRTVADLLK